MQTMLEDTTLTTLASRSKRFIRAPRPPPCCLKDWCLFEGANFINSTFRAPTATVIRVNPGETAEFMREIQVETIYTRGMAKGVLHLSYERIEAFLHMHMIQNRSSMNWSPNVWHKQLEQTECTHFSVPNTELQSFN